MQALLLNDGKCALAFVDIKESIGDFCISSEEGLYLCSCNSEKRKKEYIYGRIAAKFALRLLSTNSEAIIRNDSIGKPYFVGRSDFSLSITHSHGIVAVLVFPAEMRCGIDLELINERRKDTLNKMFSTSHGSIYKLTELWTLKEAMYKTGTNEKLEYAATPKMKMDELLHGMHVFFKDTSSFVNYYSASTIVGVTIRISCFMFGLVQAR